ncbi:MAG: RDD family protein [Candidatus Aminicenantes bacterium]|nr:RDD family protein [Candidatus Aminicenantes bacterium]
MDASLKKRVGFVPRLGAFIIDSFIITLLASILMSVFMESTFAAFIKGHLTESLLNNDTLTASIASQEAYGEMLRISLFIAHFSTLYMILEAFLGATPGKMILGLKIGTQDGKAGDMWVYFPRFVIKNCSVLIDLAGRITGITFLGAIGGFAGIAVFFGCIYALGEKKQALHDILAKTAVFRKKDLS